MHTHASVTALTNAPLCKSGNLTCMPTHIHHFQHARAHPCLSGHGADWLRARLQDGTRFKLVIFPASGGTVATWDGVFDLVLDVYGEEAHERILPFREAVEVSSQDEIDPAGVIEEVSKLAVPEKVVDTRFINIERFLAIPKRDVTVYDARAFLNHTVGCNKYFQGTGMNARGEPEILQPNRPISAIPGAVVLNMDFSLEDLADAEAQADTEAQD